MIVLFLIHAFDQTKCLVFGTSALAFSISFALPLQSPKVLAQERHTTYSILSNPLVHVFHHVVSYYYDDEMSILKIIFKSVVVLGKILITIT